MDHKIVAKKHMLTRTYGPTLSIRNNIRSTSKYSLKYFSICTNYTTINNGAKDESS